MTEQAKERRRKLDHERYIRQRDERLKKAREKYYADLDASREYYRNYHRERVLREFERLNNIKNEKHS